MGNELDALTRKPKKNWVFNPKYRSFSWHLAAIDERRKRLGVPDS